jgi:hypothetical protein
MGQQLPCTAHYNGRISEGTALLESRELIFRGEFRLVIPFAAMRDVVADAGSLRVTFGPDIATFQIGAAAAKWASAIKNPKSVLDKLGIKAGMSVALVSLPKDELSSQLEERGAKVTRGAPRRPVDAILFGAEESDALRRLPDLRRRLQPHGALWVIRPKGVARITEREVMAAGKAAGLVDTKVVSFSDTHTAERFVIPLSDR